MRKLSPMYQKRLDNAIKIANHFQDCLRTGYLVFDGPINTSLTQDGTNKVVVDSLAENIINISIEEYADEIYIYYSRDTMPNKQPYTGALLYTTEMDTGNTDCDFCKMPIDKYNKIFSTWTVIKSFETIKIPAKF